MRVPWTARISKEPTLKEINPKNSLEELYQKDLNEPDYYNGVINHPESDILESEVKWALRSTAVNKDNGCDGIPVELFKTLEDDAIKVLHSICQQIWKTQQWPQDWKIVNPNSNHCRW